jgi:hypothetical protein
MNVSEKDPAPIFREEYVILNVEQAGASKALKQIYERSDPHFPVDRPSENFRGECFQPCEFVAVPSVALHCRTEHGPAFLSTAPARSGVETSAYRSQRHT